MKLYDMCFRVWNTTCIPLVIGSQKWFKEKENLMENDIVHFTLMDSQMAPDWRKGKLEFSKLNRDKKVRQVGISYKSQDVGENN